MDIFLPELTELTDPLTGLNSMESAFLLDSSQNSITYDSASNSAIVLPEINDLNSNDNIFIDQQTEIIDNTIDPFSSYSDIDNGENTNLIENHAADSLTGIDDQSLLAGEADNSSLFKTVKTETIILNHENNSFLDNTFELTETASLLSFDFQVTDSSTDDIFEIRLDNQPLQIIDSIASSNPLSLTSTDSDFQSLAVYIPKSLREGESIHDFNL